MSDARTQDSALSNDSEGQIIRRLIKEIGPERNLLFGALLLYIPILVAQLGQPLVIIAITDEGYKAKDLEKITLWAGVFLAMVFIQSAVEMGQLYLMQLMGQRSVMRLRSRLFAKIQRLPMSFFDYVPLGKVMTRVTNDVESLAELFSSGAVRIIGDLLFLLGTLVWLFVIDWKLALAAIATLPILAIGLQIFRVRAREAFRAVRAKLSQLNGYLQEHLSGMHIVQLFAQEKRIRESFEKDNLAYMMVNRSAIALDAGIYAFVDAMSSVAVAVVLLAGAGLHERGLVTVGVLVGFEQALRRFFFPIRELSNKYTIIQSAIASAERIYGLEDEDDAIHEIKDPKPATFEKEITFENVVFAYKSHEISKNNVDVLRGLTFTVKKGESVAVVGHTGAGKSTVVKLLDRTYDVKSGRIAIDGVDLRDVDLKALRALSTSVPQDVFLFSGTIRENLAYGNGSIDDDELIRAAALCQAEAVLTRHGGLDAEVKERGTNFSLGERQLLALVRALVTGPPILILDEATASVDRETERLLQAATEASMKGRTSLIVAHRLATIRQCDRILVLHKGQVAESGTHEELMALGGRYHKLVELQQRSGG